MIRQLLFFICLLFTGVGLRGQSRFSEDIDFIHYLSENDQLNDALFLIKKIDTRSLNVNQKDSLNYFTARIFHNLKMPDSASTYFSKINSGDLFQRSVFYNSMDLLYAKKPASALQLMKSVNDTGTVEQLKQLDVAAIYLIKRNFKAFDSTATYFDKKNYIYSDEQEHMFTMEKRLKTMKRKSPFVAGLLSAAVPGLGKFYAGKKGAALASFATTMALAAITAESVYRSGIKSPQTIVFGSIFTVFYMGNIFGSAYSVKIQKRNYNNKINNEIVATLHIPIKRFFN